MKISYIILPFENTEYLIRCVNSLYRQIGDDYEVILGENFFWKNSFGDNADELTEENSEEMTEDSFGELRKFLEEKEKLIRISQYPKTNEEKLKEAFSLVSDNSDYVMLIDVDTVVSPVAAQEILSCEEAELLIPAAAIRKGDGFAVDAPDEKYLLKNMNKFPPQRFCYSRNLFEKLEPKFLVIQDLFYIFVVTLFSEEKIIKTVDEICVYSKPFAVSKQEEQGFEKVKENSLIIFDRLFGIMDTEAQILIFERLIFQIAKFLGAEEYEVREEALSVLQDIGSAVEDKLLFRKFFEVKIGFDIKEFLSLDYSEYEIYKARIVNKKTEAATAAADIAKQEKMIKELGNAVEAVKKELGTVRKDIEAGRKDIAGFAKSQNQAVAAVVGAKQNYSDPALDIPKMYREGRLGLKTIIRSFSSWLKYKFSRKK